MKNQGTSHLCTISYRITEARESHDNEDMLQWYGNHAGTLSMQDPIRGSAGSLSLIEPQLMFGRSQSASRRRPMGE